MEGTWWTWIARYSGSSIEPRKNIPPLMGKVRAEESIGLIILSSILRVRIEIPCICYTDPNSPTLPSLPNQVHKYMLSICEKLIK